MQAVERSWDKTEYQSISQQIRAAWQMIVVLFKLRVVFLLVLASLGGAALGVRASGQSSLGAWLILIVTGTGAAAGASAVNQYLERHKDAQMARTAQRPLANGQISRPGVVLVIAVGLVLASVLGAAAFNPIMALWIFLGALIYVAVYTVWLKPRTTLNIVIGGAAGSCAVISGGAAMNAWNDGSVWILALLVFVWTPVHFWALALAYREDYAAANYPMLPARTGLRAAAGWTAFHTFLTVTCGLALGLYPATNWLYLIPVMPVSAILIWRTYQLLANPNHQTAINLFLFSNLYLTAVLVVTMLAFPLAGAGK